MSRIASASLCVLLLPGGLLAQAAAYRYVDQEARCSNANPVSLTALSLPKLGTML